MSFFNTDYPFCISKHFYLMCCSIIDRFTLDAFSYGIFDYEVDSMHDEDAILYQFMKVFNESSAADNPIAGLASKYLFIDM